MKNILCSLIVWLCVSCLMAGCEDEDLEVQLSLSSPKEGAVITNETIRVEGVIHSKKIRYFFYQVEDGHTFLGEGIIHTDPKGRFETDIKLTKPPTNEHIAVLFYLDADDNGKFDVEIDTETPIGMVALKYKKRDNPAEITADLNAAGELFDPDVIKTLKKQIFEIATALRVNWKTPWEQFANQKLSAFFIGNDYIVTWAGDSAGQSVLVVFKNVNHAWKAIFSDLVGRDVYTIGLVENFEKGSLLTVDSYYPAGAGEKTFQSAIYLINDDQTKKVWQIESAKISTRILDDGTEEELRFELSYSIFPAHMLASGESEISVHGIQTITRRNGTKVTLIEETPLHSVYVWDHREQRFVDRVRGDS